MSDSNDSNRLKILHAISPAKFGGLESVVEALVSGHLARGHDIGVFAAVGSTGHPYVQNLRSLGAEVVESVGTSKDVIAQKRLLTRTIADFNPDVLHSHGYRSDISDVPTATKLDVATVSTLHGFTGGDWKMRIYEALQMRALKKASAVVAVSNNVLARAEKFIDRSNLHLIPNAYTQSISDPSIEELTRLDRNAAQKALGLADEDRNNPKTTMIGWVGRFSEEKGPDIVINAFNKVASKSNARLILVGDGPLRSKLEHTVAHAKLSDRVVFCGTVPAAGRLLSAFDILALSSRTEGTPIVLLEAMASKVAIVANSVGGVVDMLSEDEAFLVSSTSSEAFASALEQALNSPQERARRADNAYETLKDRFSLEPWLDRYESLYRSLI